MGDRANICVKRDDADPGVYLYSHWGGTNLPQILQQALAKKERWSDTSYLTRIIFCQMVKGREDKTTGYGISTVSDDGMDRILEVNVDRQTITQKTLQWTTSKKTPCQKIVTFEEFVLIPQPAWIYEEERETPSLE